MFIYSHILDCNDTTLIVIIEGLRISCVLSAFAMALGTGIRCITAEPPNVNWSVLSLSQATIHYMWGNMVCQHIYAFTLYVKKLHDYAI